MEGGGNYGEEGGPSSFKWTCSLILVYCLRMVGDLYIKLHCKNSMEHGSTLISSKGMFKNLGVHNFILFCRKSQIHKSGEEQSLWNHNNCDLSGFNELQRTSWELTCILSKFFLSCFSQQKMQLRKAASMIRCCGKMKRPQQGFGCLVVIKYIAEWKEEKKSMLLSLYINSGV